jgi:hypothetical protein
MLYCVDESVLPNINGAGVTFSRPWLLRLYLFVDMKKCLVCQLIQKSFSLQFWESIHFADVYSSFSAMIEVQHSVLNLTTIIKYRKVTVDILYIALYFSFLGRNWNRIFIIDDYFCWHFNFRLFRSLLLFQ